MQELAYSLNVSGICINGIDNLDLRIQTKGDVYALFTLYTQKLFVLMEKIR